ncbi:MAG TPA: SAM-dependent chlorinase/fluorinase [Planctomycetaceae bacterium]|jgi:S-adenosylmethionine hydrolase|nr:SAM-dependent chlorinase/fluorinase [Planctomycetaceae bacterium]
MQRPLITLTTDFGFSDSYVAQMKGAILTIAPDVVLIDVTHKIPPQDRGVAAAVLADAVGAFPAGTIHLVVVDPGVGTPRRAVAVEVRGPGDAGELRFVAPDNGVLTRVMEGRSISRAVQLTESRFWRASVSRTFHGRDVFGPVAAHWSLGIDLAEFGPPLDSPLVELALPQPTRQGQSVCGEVLRTDTFGNLITNIPATQLPEADWPRLTVEIGTQRIQGISRAYLDRSVGELVAVIGSSGLLEIAICCGHAGEILAAWSGDKVVVRGLAP